MVEVDVSSKKKSIVAFKKRFEKEKISIDFGVFSKYFFVESFFFQNRIPYRDEKFYETLFEIVGNLFKNNLQEFEYYINLKGGNKIMEIDSIVLNEYIDKSYEIYLKLHKNYKQFHLLALNFDLNSVKVVVFLNEVFPLFEEINNFVKNLQEKMVLNLEKEILKLNDEKKIHFESSIFN